MPRRRDGIYHRKDGLWEARYVKEVDLTGKKKYGSVYGHSYKEAREKRQDALAHIVLYQKPPSARRITVKELAAEWLLVNQSRLKPSTCQRYQGFLKNHLEGSLGAMEVLYVTTVTIHQFAVERLASGLAPQTVNAILTATAASGRTVIYGAACFCRLFPGRHPVAALCSLKTHGCATLQQRDLLRMPMGKFLKKYHWWLTNQHFE